MAAISITPANVALTSSTSYKDRLNPGEAIVQGKVIYKTNNLYYVADSTIAGQLTDVRIAITPGDVNIPIIAAHARPLTIGGTVVVGESYYLADATGQIIPKADLTTGDIVTFLGVGWTTTQIYLAPFSSGKAAP